jgi:hypothetical protein
MCCFWNLAKLGRGLANYPFKNWLVGSTDVDNILYTLYEDGK